MPRLTRVEARAAFHLYLEYDDGTAGEIDMTGELWGPVFEPLRHPEAFAQVFLDDFGAPAWPNGADFAPDAAYRLLVTKGHGAA